MESYHNTPRSHAANLTRNGPKGLLNSKYLSLSALLFAQASPLRLPPRKAQ
jgi:hypothetical protein